VDVELGATVFSLYSIHFKSRRPGAGTNSGLQRLDEARELKAILQREMSPGALFAVAGDFNDEADSPALQTLLADLKSALDILPERRRATFPGKNPRRQIDFVLCPPEISVESAKVWKEARCSDHCLVVAEFRLSQ
jgi:endonuclease/exonuclease/phosphatase family metal-dependent hydrolase